MTEALVCKHSRAALQAFAESLSKAVGKAQRSLETVKGSASMQAQAPGAPVGRTRGMSRSRPLVFLSPGVLLEMETSAHSRVL